MSSEFQTQDIVVMKFGGASLSSPEQFDKIADQIAKRAESSSRLVVVVSAMGKTTHELINLAKEVSPVPPQREYDMLISAGERISTSLLAMSLSNKGVQAISLTGSQAGIITCPNHTEACVIDVRPKRIFSSFQQGHVVIVAGFQGVSTQGEITTLGKGGSDTTAVALGIALNAHVVEFYKENPRFISHDAKTNTSSSMFRQLTYQQALDLLNKEGGKTLHPRAVCLAALHRIPLAIFPIDSTQEIQNSILIAEQIALRSPLKKYEQSLRNECSLCGGNVC
jgi:aspartate kinase